MLHPACAKGFGKYLQMTLMLFLSNSLLFFPNFLIILLQIDFKSPIFIFVTFYSYLSLCLSVCLSLSLKYIHTYKGIRIYKRTYIYTRCTHLLISIFEGPIIPLNINNYYTIYTEDMFIGGKDYVEPARLFG